MSESHYDVLVIGSGFGGSVTALRLTEKGYRVGVLEAGRRFADDELAATSWRVRDYVYAPRLGMSGIQRMDLLGDVLVLSGAGVGGGSLVYANTLYEPPAAFYEDPSWAGITDWRDELRASYDQAKRMLGVTTYPRRTPSDEVMRDAAAALGVEDSFVPTPVGVLRGEDHGVGPGEDIPDPFFGGAGPARTTCTDCGSCMTGCRVGAKNTLVKNYLHLAEGAGAEVHALTTVTDVRPLPTGGYVVATRPSGGVRAGRVFTADQVVFAAAALGTQKLLHRLRASGSLPHVSPGSASCRARTRRQSSGSGRSARDGTAPRTSARASPSPRRSTSTSPPTWSRCATAPARTRWRCSWRRSPIPRRACSAGGSGCARCGATAARSSPSTTRVTGRSAPSCSSSCSRSTTR
ncbi:NAD(P)-dependent oxidoreductase [Nocardioides zeae]